MTDPDQTVEDALEKLLPDELPVEEELEKLEFELVVEEMVTKGAGAASLTMKGRACTRVGDDSGMTATLTTKPYIAKQIPLTSRWRVTMERIG